MKTKGIVLSFIASSLMGISPLLASKAAPGETPRPSEDSQLEFFPVKTSKTGGKDCLQFSGQCLLKLSRKPGVVLKDFSYEVLNNNPPALKIYVDQNAANDLNALTTKHKNHRLAIVLNGKVLTAPYIASSINSEALVISFKDPQSLSDLVNTLEGA